MLRYYNESFIQALKAVYPEYPWKPWSVKRPHQVSKGSIMFSKTQQKLFRIVQVVSIVEPFAHKISQIFPSYPIEFNYKYVQNTSSKQFDVSTIEILVIK